MHPGLTPALPSYARLCPLGTYCPERSSHPVMCPAGTYAPADFFNNSRSAVENSCTMCPKGTFGDDPLRLSCATCLPGFICLGGTTSSTPQNNITERGFECPKGHFCPAGSWLPSSCPVATFNPKMRSWNSSDCIVCAQNTYNTIEGQDACKPCSSRFGL